MRMEGSVYGERKRIRKCKVAKKDNKKETRKRKPQKTQIIISFHSKYEL